MKLSSPFSGNSDIRLIWKTFFVAGSLLAGAISAPVIGAPASAPRSSPQALSVLEVPLRFSLQGLFKETEHIVPRQVGHWRDWKRRHGIDTQYRVWRGPLVFRLSGDTLSMQAHVRYWVKVRKKLLGSLGVNASCGVEEPPRQAVIGVQVRLAWNPDWTMRPLFRLLPTRFLDRCEMTIADIDVTPLVGKLFRERMKDSLRRALTSLSTRMRSVRNQAEDIWRRLNEPIPITDDSRLQLNPVGLALSPVFGSRNNASVHLAVAMQPNLNLDGSRPLQRPVPLPFLRPFFPSSAGLRFHLNLKADYTRLSQLISVALAEQEFEVRTYKFGVESVELSGKEQGINAKLRLNGQAAGSAEIWAEVDFDPELKTFRLKGLDYLFEPIDSDVYLLASLFYEKIRQVLLETANELLEREMETVRTRLEDALIRITPEGSKLDLGQIHLDSIRLQFTQDGVLFEGTAAGSVRVNPS